METNNKNPVAVFLASLIFLLYSFAAQFCHAIDIIRQGEIIGDGETLISENGIFELGFFSPENSPFRFVGIWYKIDVKTDVWVANRDSPISDRSGVLRIGVDGNLVVLDGNKSLVWSTNVSGLSTNTAAILRNTGNLVLSNNDTIGDDSRAHWQSFNHPTDTFLPGMRVPVNSAIGEYRAFRAWKSANDPSPGNYTMGVDPDGGPQIVIWDQMRRRWRSGQWNSVIFTGVPEMSNTASFLYGFKLSHPDENRTQYFTYDPSNSSTLFRFRIGWDGKEQQLMWDDGGTNWTVLHSQPDSANKCELYNYCGNYATCHNFNSPSCNCLEGFRPKFPEQWSRGNWSGGCERRIELQCHSTNGTAGGNGKPDGFKGLNSMKLPDLSSLWLSAGNLDACRASCLGNCSCTACSFILGIGCMIWTGELVDIQHLDQSGSLQFFYRLHHSEIDGTRKISNLVIIIISLVGACFLAVSLWLLWRYKKNLKGLPAVSSMPCCKDEDVAVFDVSKSKGKEVSSDLSEPSDILIDRNEVNRPELPIFNFSTVAAATNSFCEGSRLGQGGFGAVYKGELPGGQEIAVKRLSGQSGQGLEEFKNEIILIAKLQHRNLVRLLGCSIQGEEKILIYEYMPNKSLDSFLFDEAKQAQLDWRTRLSIIEGIARGLLYLHRDSRLRIIHRDLKASNILLDAEMNPKISDFGMARIFGGNQNEANTVRVVGTYGYMSPEYAMEGLFSVKSDVYSFGVLLLEIVGGRRNTGFRSSEHTSLIAYAWHLWMENKAMDLVDPCIRDSCPPNEVLKCIHIGMLCVQDSAMHRPTMAAVVLMLESETPTLPMPRQPTYTSKRRSIDSEFIWDGQEIVSSNDVTVTMVVGR
ncbi:G-type lectin S-receptor-like serine/threonine-protein kinase B120 isoform X2 [Durio zibethinus]|uniref:Receptor-like serine/threonine-protein kinase n=1 Tax=Durio zibethinus TaxID=66656 RepID=A0A6P5X923_DURZI|nr:G-type lectin S-receptor-like serine/threonine-protein kinase B120 isoform X2 [Durio zibethinus]